MQILTYNNILHRDVCIYIYIYCNSNSDYWKKILWICMSLESGMIHAKNHHEKQARIIFAIDTIVALIR